MSLLERIPPNPVDVAVIGAGPAGVALARALAERGCSVICVAPDPVTPWKPRYGAWADEVAPFDLETTIERTYTTARLTTTHESHVVDTGYVRFSTEKLQECLQSQATREGVIWWSATIAKVTHEREESVLSSESGGEIRAHIVVDATGANRAFSEATSGPPPAYQTAYGELIVAPGHPFKVDEAVVMDYSLEHDDSAVPTFLYALPIDTDTVFVEETSLVAPEPIDFEVLKRRLYHRLEGLEIRPQEVLEVEYCTIPMGAALPRLGQRVLAFGAAASMVHPATGYQLMHALRLAGPVADAVVMSLEKAAGPQAAVRAGYRVIWSRAAFKKWHLFRFGMNVLQSMSYDELNGFFGTFFSLPVEHWRGYMTGRVTPKEVSAAMMQLFKNADGKLRRRLAMAGTFQQPGALLRAFWPRWSK